MTQACYDLAVIGGGINGAGIAADASARGLEVVLFEKADLASGTSSASSKLIHGGLRYLEHYDFRLVREALMEREVLLAKAPHIIWPMRFVLPHVEGMRARHLIRAGLFLYDHMARRRLIPASSSLDLTLDPMGRALKPVFAKGYSYWDCWADDARLVVLNARAAALNGAAIHTRTRVTKLSVDDGLWNIETETAAKACHVRARALVNASGPWVDEVAKLYPQSATQLQDGGRPRKRTIRLVKGSHIVVPRIAGATDAFLLQSGDGRVVFALPFEQRFTLFGTTDVPFTGNADTAGIEDSEVDYLLSLANQFFERQLGRHDIVWKFSGVRPLFDDGSENASAVSRDYRLELTASSGAPPLVTVLGGKLTTYRKLAQAAVDLVAPHFPGLKDCSTAQTLLPGGDLGPDGVQGYARTAYERWPGISKVTLDMLIRRYGSLTEDVLGDAKTRADLGADFGGQLSEREVSYLARHEWAREPSDVLWRRTKAGLHITEVDRESISEQIGRILRDATF